MRKHLDTSDNGNMQYLHSIEISHLEMSPSEEQTFAVSGITKKATYTLIGFKLLELCLLICCIGLVDEPATHSIPISFMSPRVIALCYVTFGALLVYTAIYLLMLLFGDLTGWRTGVVWNFVGLILFAAVTILLFRDWSNTKNLNYWHPNMIRLDLVLATASVSLVTSLVYLADMLVTARFGVRGDLE